MMGVELCVDQSLFSVTCFGRDVKNEKILVGSNLGYIIVLEKSDQSCKYHFENNYMNDEVVSFNVMYTIEDNKYYHPINQIYNYNGINMCATVGQINCWSLPSDNNQAMLIHSYNLDQLLNRRSNDMILVINEICAIQNTLICAINHYGICCIDINTQKITQMDKFSKLSDNIICAKESNQCCIITDNEGHVYIYDMRSNNLKPEITLIPYKNQLLWDSGRTKSITNVAMNSYGWLVAAGGPRLSLWHTKTLSMVEKLYETNDITNQVGFVDSNIIVVGNQGNITSYDIMGQLKITHPSFISPLNAFIDINEGFQYNTFIIGGKNSNICHLSSQFLHHKTIPLF